MSSKKYRPVTHPEVLKKGDQYRQKGKATKWRPTSFVDAPVPLWSLGTVEYRRPLK